MTERFTAVGDHIVHSKSWNEEAGGTAVVFVHGLACSTMYGEPLCRELASRGLAAFAPELPGYGKSSKLKQSLATPTLGAILMDWIETIGLERVVFVANSYGCQIAAEAAAVAPERVERIVMIGAVDDRVRTPAVFLFRGALDAPFERFWDLAIKPYDWGRMGFMNGIRTLRELTHHDISPPLRAAGVPVTVIRGRFDPISPRRWCQLLTNNFGDGPLVEVKRCGHDVHVRKAAHTADLVKALLDKVGSNPQ